MKILSALFLTTTFLFRGSSALEVEEFFGGVDTEAYVDWNDEFGVEYPSEIFLPSSDDPDNGAALHWRIDDSRIYLAVAARATGESWSWSGGVWKGTIM